ncbi:MAG: hypothetical protein R2824_02995 [Saprospiraceae bacterium]|nr:hypothetical protein [Lewinella sp.]
MILPWIILFSIGQIIGYRITDHFGFRTGRILILLSVLIHYFFILPPWFFPESDTEGINCGMPALGITLAFWIVGGAMAIIVHLAYYFYRKSQEKDEMNML